MDNTHDNGLTPVQSATPDRQQHFVSLLQAHPRLVSSVVCTYCWHADDRKDLAQDITVQLWRAFPAYEASGTFSTWAYRIALNVAISWVRRQTVRQRHTAPHEAPVEDVVDPASLAPLDDRAEFLQRLLDSLDPMNRALLMLYLEGHRYREISAVLGISHTNVSTKISRLKQRVKALLAEDSNDGDPHEPR